MVTFSYAVYQKCCGCKKGLRNVRNVTRIGEKTIEKTRAFFKNELIQISAFICGNCRTKVNTISSNEPNESSSEDGPNGDTNDEINDGTLVEVKANKAIEKLDRGKQIQLLCAYSTHKHCLLCNKNNGLHQIKNESIIFAYKNFGILIKHHSRCCDAHLDTSGLIKIDEYSKIRTQSRLYDKDTIKMLDIILATSEKISCELQNSSGIFDKFNDIASLDDEFCKKITGWTKLQFLSFSKFIHNVRDTAGRTKEQLIAIYRYWLKKGLDQSTLAMLKSHTSQQQISHYLAQIRHAINEEFVPLFLGANKGKDFFLKHNTVRVRALHDFGTNEILAVIADGTYTRIEKSFNNDFQYMSYSVQKSQNLIKPFILCCTDGYFIDCYGPFQANMNDAQILRYILNTDEDLKLLFSEKDKIIIFLDRGFRDNYWELTKEGYNIQIPTCAQLEDKKKQIDTNYESEDEKKSQKNEKALTTAQNGETRLVTAVRYKVENQIGVLKCKEALDNIRNTEVGHIQIDYRIMCAMWNFAMVPNFTEDKESFKIAKSIRKKCLKRQNKLASLLNMKFTSTVASVDIKVINDFPKLSLSELKKKIVLGSFKIKQSLSYIGQLLEYGRAYVLNDQLIQKYVSNVKVKQELNDSKIVAVLMPSRHKRGKKWKPSNKKQKKDDPLDPKTFNTYYKVFIQYEPVVNSKNKERLYRNIKRYICSCLSGRQVAGCCVHVTSVIHYLSYVKDKYEANPKYIKFPSMHLMSTFVNINNFEKPNVPRHVKHKRRHVRYILRKNELDNLSSDSTTDISSDDDEPTLKLEKKTDEKSILSKKKNISYKKAVNSNQNQASKVSNTHSVDHYIPAFTAHIPPWGGFFTKNKKQIEVINTCTIDNYLFAFWVLSKIVDQFPEKILDFEHSPALLDLIEKINSYEWNCARQIWYTKIMKMEVNKKKSKINFYGTVEDFLIKYMYGYQEHELFQKCVNNCSLNGSLISKDANVLHLGKLRTKEIGIVTDLSDKCKECRNRVTCDVRFRHNPLFVFIETSSHLKINELPKNIEIQNKTYKLLNVIFYLHAKRHFVSVFDINNQKVLIDDLSRESMLLKEGELKNGINFFNLSISSALYYLFPN